MLVELGSFQLVDARASDGKAEGTRLETAGHKPLQMAGIVWISIRMLDSRYTCVKPLGLCWTFAVEFCVSRAFQI